MQQISERLLRLLADESAEGRVRAEAVAQIDLLGELRLPGIAQRFQIGAELSGHADDGFGVLAPDRADGDGHDGLSLRLWSAWGPAIGPWDARRYRPRGDARRQPRCSAGWSTARNGRAAPGLHASRRRRPADAWQRNGARHAAWPSPANRAAAAASASPSAPGAGSSAGPWRRGRAGLPARKRSAMPSGNR